MVSQCVGSVGPAGMLLADDTEMYERNQAGRRSADAGVARRAPWAAPRAHRRQRFHDRRGHRRDRHARLLATLQVADGGDVTTVVSTEAGLGPVPDGFDRHVVEQFLYREARLADERDYDAWEALWTDDALYWVPVDGEDGDPQQQMSIIYDNRNRISTRLKQLRTGKRYAQSPPSNLRRLLSNIEFLGGRQNSDGGIDLEVGANFLAIESRVARNPSVGRPHDLPVPPARRTTCCSPIRRWCWWTTIKPLPTLGFLI